MSSTEDIQSLKTPKNSNPNTQPQQTIIPTTEASFLPSCQPLQPPHDFMLCGLQKMNVLWLSPRLVSAWCNCTGNREISNCDKGECHWRYLTPQPKKCMNMVSFVSFIIFFASLLGEARQAGGQKKKQQFLNANDIEVLYQALITSSILWNPSDDRLLPLHQGGALGSVGKRSNPPNSNTPTLCPPLHYT